MANVKLSQITSGGALNTTTDVLVGVRGGSTDVLLTPGTLAGLSAVALASNVSGTLPFANGGTGQTSYTDGQLLIGNTATGGLSKATITAGSNITVTNSNGAITIASTGGGGGGGLTFNNVTTTTQSMAANNGYSANNASLVTLTLPATCAFGATLAVSGFGAGGWLIAQNSGQTMHFNGINTTTGAGGSLASTSRYDVVYLLCAVANTDFVVQSASSYNGLTIV